MGCLKKRGRTGFPRYPAGLFYWRKDYKSIAYVTGKHISSAKPPSRSRFFGVPYGMWASGLLCVQDYYLG